jgi:hypothetical protein
MGTILLIILILLVVGALPAWPYSSGWGYYPLGRAGTRARDPAHSRAYGKVVTAIAPPLTVNRPGGASRAGARPARFRQ